jgi:hypothetical protein
MTARDAVSEQTSKDLLKKSSLYREFEAEREEILKHKWIESERVGYDIGFEHSLTEWIMRHRSRWRKSRGLALASDGKADFSPQGQAKPRPDSKPKPDKPPKAQR